MSTFTSTRTSCVAKYDFSAEQRTMALDRECSEGDRSVRYSRATRLATRWPLADFSQNLSISSTFWNAPSAFLPAPLEAGNLLPDSHELNASERVGVRAPGALVRVEPLHLWRVELR